eukprot:gene12640-15873_t
MGCGSSSPAPVQDVTPDKQSYVSLDGTTPKAEKPSQPIPPEPPKKTPPAVEPPTPAPAQPPPPVPQLVEAPKASPGEARKKRISANCDFSMKHIKAKDNFAICMGGGGFRAATCALGWVRALQSMGLLKRARYLCTNSGSTWFAAPFIFQKQTPMAAFLGPYIPPEQCTFEAVAQMDYSSFGKVLADAEPIKSYFKELLDEAFDGDDNMKAWSESMSKAFLEPYGLGEYRSCVTAARTSAHKHADATEQASSLGIRMMTALTDANVPYPIFCASIINDDQPQKFMPYEFTPLYCGCPSSNPDVSPIPVGAGYTEPMGLNSEPNPDADGSATSMEVTSNGVVPLADMMGTSSNFVAQSLRPSNGIVGSLHAAAIGVPTFNYWNPADVGKGAAYVPFGDGGGSDALAILPALRRGVTKLLVLTPLSKPLAEMDLEAWAKYDYDISRYFGRYPADGEGADGMTAEVMNSSFKVFESDGLDALYEGLKSSAEAGGPCCFKAAFTTVDSRAMGVKGGLTVDVMWVANQQSTTWEAALPAEVKEKIDSDRSCFFETVEQKLSPFSATGYKEFPTIDKNRMNYDPDLVGMMSQLASWNLNTLKDDLEAFLSS